MSTEAQRVYQREWARRHRASMTPDERAAASAAASDRRQRRRASITPDQLEAENAASRERSRRRREQHPEKARAYRQANQDANREYQRDYRAAHPALYRDASRRFREAHPERAREQSRASDRKRYAKLRDSVLSHYGRQCACCGGTAYLQIDHVNGDGHQHREELFGGQQAGRGMYEWLVRNGFPPGFQTLCKACNSSKKNGPACRIDHVKAER